ncbi:MAG TPA: OmpH family outer membrane protein, partial [Vicinamibacterales bacterium]|nr:OmpH family outer membrane protein [Vicinamibacterales bacterium]
MRRLQRIVVVGAVSAVLAAGPAFAQTPAPQKPPDKPPATPGVGTQPPTPAPQPPAPYPEGAKTAFVDLQVIASNSIEGKAASSKIQDFSKKKQAELAEKQKALQGMNEKLKQGGSVLSDQARSQLEKDIDRTTRELQFAQQDAQAELEQMQNELQQDFNRKLGPILDQVAKEKGLHFLLSIRDAGALWAAPGLDLSEEVVKRFDAASKAPAAPDKK